MTDLPKWQVACIRAVLEIVMAMIGGTGSAAAMVIAFSLESILSRVCLVGRRGLLMRGVCAWCMAAAAGYGWALMSRRQLFRLQHTMVLG